MTPISNNDEAAYLVSVGILTKWHSKTLSEYDNDTVALKKVKDYIDNFKEFKDDGVGLFLYGFNGTGKSHLLNCAFKQLLHKRQKVQIISFYDLITNFVDGWYDTDKRAVLNSYKNADFLAIEEIGKEFQSKNSELALTVFDNILRYRIQMLKPTWFTSNKKPNDIASLYSEDVASMLREGTIAVNVIGDDYRTKIHQENKKRL